MPRLTIRSLAILVIVAAVTMLGAPRDASAAILANPICGLVGCPGGSVGCAEVTVTIHGACEEGVMCCPEADTYWEESFRCYESVK